MNSFVYRPIYKISFQIHIIFKINKVQVLPSIPENHFYYELLDSCKSSYLKFHLLVDVRQTELLQEALVLTPEEADVWDVIQDHGQSF